jgi:hypothetical protein
VSEGGPRARVPCGRRGDGGLDAGRAVRRCGPWRPPVRSVAKQRGGRPGQPTAKTSGSRAGAAAQSHGAAEAWGRAAAARCQAWRSARRGSPAECCVTTLVILGFQPEPEPPVHLNRPKNSGFDLAGRRARPRGGIRPLAGARGARKVQSSKGVGRRASRECAGPNTGGGCNWVRADRKKRSMFPFDQAWSGVAGSRRRPRCGAHDARVLAAKRRARWSRCFSHNLRPCASSAPATGERG